MKHLVLIALLFFAGYSSISARESLFFSIASPDASNEKGSCLTWSTGGDTYRIYESGNIYALDDVKNTFDFMYKRDKKNVKEIFNLAKGIDFASVKKEIMLDDNPRPFIEFTTGGQSNKAIWENGTPPNNNTKLADLLEKLGGVV